MLGDKSSESSGQSSSSSSFGSSKSSSLPSSDTSSETSTISKNIPHLLVSPLTSPSLKTHTGIKLINNKIDLLIHLCIACFFHILKHLVETHRLGFLTNRWFTQNTVQNAIDIRSNLKGCIKNNDSSMLSLKKQSFVPADFRSRLTPLVA